MSISYAVFCLKKKTRTFLPARNYVLSFFFTDTPPTQIYTLSLHDALPIFPPIPRRRDGSCRSGPRACQWGCIRGSGPRLDLSMRAPEGCLPLSSPTGKRVRSEEHTSELQSHVNLVCRLLLEKKNTHLPAGPQLRTLIFLY